MLTVSDYDRANLGEILAGEGDWFDADLFRFLDNVLFKSDKEHFGILWRAFPQHCGLILEHYGWSDISIYQKLKSMGVYSG